MIYEYITGSNKPTYFIVKDEDIHAYPSTDYGVLYIDLDGILLSESNCMKYTITESENNSRGGNSYKRLLTVNIEVDEFAKKTIYRYVMLNIENLPDIYLNYIIDNLVL